MNPSKKKISQELNVYFPGRFDDAATKEYYDKLRDRALLILDSIIRENNNDEKIKKIDDYLLTLSKPQLFSGKESAEIEFDKQFNEMTIFLKEKLSIDIDKTTVLEYYQSFEYIKKTMPKKGAK